MAFVILRRLTYRLIRPQNKSREAGDRVRDYETFIATFPLSPATRANSSLITHYSLLITHYSLLLITHQSSLITHHSSLITHHFLGPSGNASAIAFSSILCSRSAFKPARTQVNPPFESSASFTTLSPSPLKPEWVTVTYVQSFL
jgi:hypothetical protein